MINNCFINEDIYVSKPRRFYRDYLKTPFSDGTLYLDAFPDYYVCYDKDNVILGIVPSEYGAYAYWYEERMHEEKIND